MCANARFSLEPVGQGLFYTGRIGSFNMVYDCGTLNSCKSINNVIREYTKNLGKSKIDMIVISHLHKDHVCGLDYLLSSVNARYVFLPYLLPIQRLVIALSDFMYADQAYFDFLADPISFLFEKGVENVVLIGGGNNERGEGQDRTDDIDSDDDYPEINSEDLNDNSFRLDEDTELLKLVKENDNHWLFHRNNGNLHTKNHSGIVALRNKWVFKFFSPPSRVNLKAFENCILSKLPGVMKLDNGTIRNIISNKTERAKIKGCYEKYFKRLNDTSLMLYHGPTGKATLFLQSCRIGKGSPVYSRPFVRSPLYEKDTKYGWLLTGDINFNIISTDLIKHYKSHINEIRHLLIPHHGSKGNWNTKILNSVQSPSHWYVSFGLGNQYRHPNTSVIRDVRANGGTVSLSNETMRVDQYVSF